MREGQHNPCNNLIHWLLLEHRNSAWKINRSITYNKFLPRSKQFLNKWINDNLFGPTKLMLLETMKSITRPNTLASRYKKIHSDIWTILEEPKIREIVELDSIFGLNPTEIQNRLNSIFKPRVINVKAVEQFMYFFWNLKDNNAVFRPGLLLKFIESNRELSKVYSHILKYSNDKLGREKYEYNYNLYNPEEPNLRNMIKVIDLITYNQIDALDNNNIDKLETYVNIQLKNSIAFKTVKTIPNNTKQHDYSDIVGFEDE